MSESKPKELHLLLYGTSACHLCEQALSLFDGMALPCDITLDEVDIVDSDAMMANYAARIPVLALAHTPNIELAWPYDQGQLLQFLQDQMV